MAELAIWMLVVFGVLAVVVRVAIQVIRTGRTGLIGVRRGVGPLGWLAAVLFNGGWPSASSRWSMSIVARWTPSTR